MPFDDDNFEKVLRFKDAAETAGLYSESTGLVSGAGLPTSDPAVAGALWNSSGVVHVSAG